MILPKGDVYFVVGCVDMRGGVNKLCGVLVGMGVNPSLGDGYVFVNRGRNQVKGIYFDGNGFVLLCKKLEGCRFQVEELGGEQGCGSGAGIKSSLGMVLLKGIEVQGLLSGLDIKKLKIPGERVYDVF